MQPSTGCFIYIHPTDQTVGLNSFTGLFMTIHIFICGINHKAYCISIPSINSTLTKSQFDTFFVYIWWRSVPSDSRGKQPVRPDEEARDDEADDIFMESD